MATVHELRLPPNDPAAEAAVLSTVLLDASQLPALRGVLEPRHFWPDANQRIWEVVLDLDRRGVPVDVVTVADALKGSGRLEQIGGTPYLARFADATPAIAHVREHAEIIVARWRERQTADIGRRLAAGAVSPATASAELDALQPVRRALPELRWLEPQRLLDRPPAREWLLTRNGGIGVLPAGRVGLLAAAGGSGKTLALVQLALAVATGSPWLDTFAVAHAGAVLLALAEEDDQEISRRLHSAANLLGLSRDERALAASRIVPLALAGSHVALTESDGRGNVLVTAVRDDLHRQLEALNVDWSLLILDPLARFAGADVEKDSNAATRLVQVLEGFTTLRGRPTVLVAHHTAKWARRSDAPAAGAEAARGATGLVDGVRWVAQLDGDGPNAAVLRVTKQNYAPPLVEDLFLLRDPEHEGALRAMGERELDDHRTERAEHRERRAGRARVSVDDLDARIREIVAQHGPQTSLAALKAHGLRGTDATLYARARALGALPPAGSANLRNQNGGKEQ